MENIIDYLCGEKTFDCVVVTANMRNGFSMMGEEFRQADCFYDADSEQLLITDGVTNCSCTIPLDSSVNVIYDDIDEFYYVLLEDGSEIIISVV